MGTNRTIAYGSGSNLGALCYDADFYPFGGELAFTNNCAQNYKFAGMERDPETGNDHTLFRSDRSNYGRWLSPDPADSAAADPTNPQTWNRYASVLNNPLAGADPLGLQGGCPDSYEPNFGPLASTPVSGCGGNGSSGGGQGGGWGGDPPNVLNGGIFVASYDDNNAPPLMPSQLDLQLANEFVQSETGAASWSTAPTGFSNATNPMYQPGSELNLGFQYVVSQIMQDPTDGGWETLISMLGWLANANETIPGQYGPGKSPGPQPSVACGKAGSAPTIAANFIGPVYQTYIGTTMSKWAAVLAAWTKANPGEVPPASLRTAPNVSCGM